MPSPRWSRRTRSAGPSRRATRTRSATSPPTASTSCSPVRRSSRVASRPTCGRRRGRVAGARSSPRACTTARSSTERSTRRRANTSSRCESPAASNQLVRVPAGGGAPVTLVSNAGDDRFDLMSLVSWQGTSVVGPRFTGGPSGSPAKPAPRSDSSRPRAPAPAASSVGSTARRSPPARRRSCSRA